MLRLARRSRSVAIQSLTSTGSKRHESWTARISEPKNKLQIYTSQSRDPFVNLSIEHHLFNKTPAGSKILFFYTNRPCVVIGRNQNPWLEVNLAALRAKKPQTTEEAGQINSENIDLVRRRSGGGTVYHDEGNVNWSVICDFTEFTRDKHAEMVVKALRRAGIDRARVNERHDIVLDQGKEKIPNIDRTDTHVTSYADATIRPLKVSGSAYKMARNRALHHGTALLSAESLRLIPELLRSPAKSLISAKGVESVSSPVGSLGLSQETFVDAITREFRSFYRVPDQIDSFDVDVGQALEIPDIIKGQKELTSYDWTYLQTPQFDFSWTWSSQFEFRLDIAHGVIKQASLRNSKQDKAANLSDSLNGYKLHEIEDWTPFMPTSSISKQSSSSMSADLKRLLPSANI